MTRSHTKQYHNAKRRATRRARSNGWQVKVTREMLKEGMAGTLWAALRMEKKEMERGARR